jgi:hypothetical protein
LVYTKVELLGLQEGRVTWSTGRQRYLVYMKVELLGLYEDRVTGLLYVGLVESYHLHH